MSVTHREQAQCKISCAVPIHLKQALQMQSSYLDSVGSAIFSAEFCNTAIFYTECCKIAFQFSADIVLFNQNLDMVQKLNCIPFAY